VKTPSAVAALLSALLSSTLAASSWPSFRGPGATGVSDARALPISWDVPAKRNVKWRTSIPGLSHASPIVWGDRIYVVSARALEGDSALDMGAEGVVFAKDATRHAWMLYALDRATGRILWERRAHEGTPRHARHVKGTYANATPATNGRFIVAVFGHEGLFCFDMEGRLQWRRELPVAKADGSLDPASSPIIFDQVAIVQVDVAPEGFIAAYDLETGRERWRTARHEGMTWSTPTVLERDGRAELVVNSPRWIRGYDARTGKQLWELDNRTDGAWDRVATPFGAGELVIVAGGGGTRPIYALRPNGRGEVAWKTERGSPYLPTPIAYQGLLYSLADNGVLSVYDLKDGAQLYQRRIITGATFSASPVAAAGRVYLTSIEGDVFVLRAGRSFLLESTNPVGEVCMATPALTEGLVVLRTASAVYGLGPV